MNFQSYSDYPFAQQVYKWDKEMEKHVTVNTYECEHKGMKIIRDKFLMHRFVMRKLQHSQEFRLADETLRNKIQKFRRDWDKGLDWEPFRYYSATEKRYYEFVQFK